MNKILMVILTLTVITLVAFTNKPSNSLPKCWKEGREFYLSNVDVDYGPWGMAPTVNGEVYISGRAKPPYIYAEIRGTSEGTQIKLYKKGSNPIEYKQTWNNDCEVSEVEEKPLTLNQNNKEDLYNTVVYVWSPSLPLSISGLNIVKELAKEKGLNFKSFTAPDVNPETIKELVENNVVEKADAQSINLSGLSRSISFHHYPALLFYKNNYPVSTAKIARRTKEQWSRDIDKLVSQKLYTPSEYEEKFNKITKSLLEIKTEVVKLKYQRNYYINDGFGRSTFYQIIPGSDFIADYVYSMPYPSYLINHKTDKKVKMEYNGIVLNDPYPSPDGKIMIFKDMSYENMYFYKTESIVNEPGPVVTDKPFEIMKVGNWYPSLGYYKKNGEKVTARIATRKGSLEVMEVEIDFSHAIPKVATLRKPTQICKNIEGDTYGPLISRDGTKIVVADEFKVLNLDEDLNCDVAIEFPFSATKAHWSQNSKMFSFRSGKDPYIYNLESNTLIRLEPIVPNLECKKMKTPKVLSPQDIVMSCATNDGAYYNFFEM